MRLIIYFPFRIPLSSHGMKIETPGTQLRGNPLHSRTERSPAIRRRALWKAFFEFSLLADLSRFKLRYTATAGLPSGEHHHRTLKTNSSLLIIAHIVWEKFFAPADLSFPRVFFEGDVKILGRFGTEPIVSDVQLSLSECVLETGLWKKKHHEPW